MLTEGFEGSGLQTAKNAAMDAHKALASAELETTDENALKWLATSAYASNPLLTSESVDDFIDAYLAALELEVRNAKAIAAKAG